MRSVSTFFVQHFSDLCVSGRSGKVAPLLIDCKYVQVEFLQIGEIPFISTLKEHSKGLDLFVIHIRADLCVNAWKGKVMPLLMACKCTYKRNLQI